MAQALPFNYYHRLPPWAQAFALPNSRPILMYHKVGRAPFFSRYRFLSVPTGLFRTQIQELHAAGFRSFGLDETGTVGPRRICITFDDGYLSVFQKAMPILNEFGFKAITYLVPPLMGRCNEWDRGTRVSVDPLMRAEHVREWLKNGHEIGAHTLSHPHLHKLSAQKACEEILGSKKQLEDIFGVPVRHFCYPYGDYSPAVRDIVA